MANSFLRGCIILHVPYIFVCWGCHNKEPKTGGSNNRELLFHNSGSQKSKIKLLARLVSSETCLHVLLMAVFSLWLYMFFPPDLLLVRTVATVGSGHPQPPHFDSLASLRNVSPNTVTVELLEVKTLINFGE